MKKSTKEVTVIAVYKFRNVARICFEVLSSNETDKYNTCFQGNGRESCTCPSKGNCYHRDGLRERAQAYFESQREEQKREQEVRRAAFVAMYDPCLVAC